MSDEEKLALDEQFYDICVNAGDTKALFDLLMKGADGAFCTKTEPMGPGSTEISALYFCSANAMWAAVPMVLAAGGDKDKQFNVRGRRRSARRARSGPAASRRRT